MGYVVRLSTWSKQFESATGYTMEQEIEYLKKEFPKSEVFRSLDIDFICVRTILGTSNFGKNDKGEQVIVPITKTEKYHIDTIRLKMRM